MLTEQLLDHRQPARDHGCGKGGATGQTGPLVPVDVLAVNREGAEIGDPDRIPGRREAISGGETAAIGKAGDLPVIAQRHHSEGMTTEFLDPGGQAGHHLHRHRIDLFALALLHVSWVAWVSVGIARGPDQDGLLSATRLRHGGDGRAEVVAKVLFAVGVDDTTVADTQVQEVNRPLADPPVENRIDQVRPTGVRVAEPGERDGVIIARARTDGDGEHGDVGAPGHTIGGRSQGRGEQTGRDTRDCGAMGIQRAGLAGLVGCAAQEHLRDLLAGERRMARIDAGVDEPDGHPCARLGALPLQQFDVGVRPIGLDRAQTPLVVEAPVVIAVLLGKPRCLSFKI